MPWPHCFDLWSWELWGLRLCAAAKWTELHAQPDEPHRPLLLHPLHQQQHQRQPYQQQQQQQQQRLQRLAVLAPLRLQRQQPWGLAAAHPLPAAMLDVGAVQRLAEIKEGLAQEPLAQLLLLPLEQVLLGGGHAGQHVGCCCCCCHLHGGEGGLGRWCW